MNLPLHYGLLGVLEACLIALLVGFVVFLLWHWLGRRAALSPGQVLGGACVMAVAIAAGLDLWNLLYLGVARLESPLYARLALQKIHDPDALAMRVVLEVLGAVAGVVLAWMMFSSRSFREDGRKV